MYGRLLPPASPRGRRRSNVRRSGSPSVGERVGVRVARSDRHRPHRRLGHRRRHYYSQTARSVRMCLGAPMTIEFGLKLADHLDIVTSARQAESMNFDYVIQGEHFFFHGPVSNSLIDLRFAAAVTQRLKLLSAATLIPLYPAVLLAKMIASLAVNSGGRFNLGVGVGGDFAAEFEACGVPMAGRGRATDAALETMKRL